jgi:hypothetical protein
LVLALAPRQAWPAPVEQASAPASPTQATVIVLLDEFSASYASALPRALMDAGLKVQAKAVESVGDKTADVIPQLFSGRSFKSAKPCGLSAICSGNYALDFSRISASRPDVDVVGFYHPYCAITGLRSCALIARTSSILDVDRWDCAWQRMALQFSVGAPSHCKEEPPLLPRFEDAIMRAPVWRQGGLLYVHVALPHLPGASAAGTMVDDYADNVDKAVSLILRMVAQARASGILQLQLVVFSDHGLRPALWCAEARYQAKAGCAPARLVVDGMVPLVVTGYGVDLPDISQVASNGHVFDLLQPWRKDAK